MSSGRIAMILTYVKNKNNNANNTTPPPPPKANNTTINRPLRYTHMNRFANVSMHNIIHKPASGCSSCGN
jgi:hypothetical protein